MTIADINRKYGSKIKEALRFGDAAQLAILSEWRREIDRFEELERARNDPDAPLREYRVTFSYRREDDEIVEATSEEEAGKIVRENHDLEEDFEIECVELIEKKSTQKIETESELWQSQEKK